MSGRARSRALAATIALLIAGCDGTPESPPAPGGISDPAAGLPVQEATDSSNQRMLQHRYDEALPFLAHVERIGAGTSADFEGAFATALGNTAIQARRIADVPLPVTRSAVERVALLRESLARVDEGLRRSTSPLQQRNLLVVRAGQLHTWGFALESYRTFWAAQERHALEGSAASEALGLELLLADPIHGLERAASAPRSD